MNIREIKELQLHEPRILQIRHVSDNSNDYIAALTVDNVGLTGKYKIKLFELNDFTLTEKKSYLFDINIKRYGKVLGFDIGIRNGIVNIVVTPEKSNSILFFEENITTDGGDNIKYCETEVDFNEIRFEANKTEDILLYPKVAHIYYIANQAINTSNDKLCALPAICISDIANAKAKIYLIDNKKNQFDLYREYEFPSDSYVNDITFDYQHNENKANETIYFTDTLLNAIYKTNIKSKEITKVIDLTEIDCGKYNKPSKLLFVEDETKLYILQTFDRTALYVVDLNTNKIVDSIDFEQVSNYKLSASESLNDVNHVVDAFLIKHDALNKEILVTTNSYKITIYEIN